VPLPNDIPNNDYLLHFGPEFTLHSSALSAPVPLQGDGGIDPMSVGDGTTGTGCEPDNPDSAQGGGRAARMSANQQSMFRSDANLNTRAYLESILATVKKHIRTLQGAPSVQMQYIPPSIFDGDEDPLYNLSDEEMELSHDDDDADGFAGFSGDDDHRPNTATSASRPASAAGRATRGGSDEDDTEGGDDDDEEDEDDYEDDD
jgi:hypothetical protein